MKSNAHLYLPSSAIADWMASTNQTNTRRPRPPQASIEKLDGGCLLIKPDKWHKKKRREQTITRMP